MDLKYEGAKKKKKILFVLVALDLGGLEQVFIKLIKGISRDKFDITVKLLYNYGRLIKEIPIDVKYSYMFEASFYIRGFTYFYKYFPIDMIADRMLYDEEYDLIVSYGEGPTTTLISKYHGSAKTISWLHGCYDKKGFAKLYGSLLKASQIHKKYDRIFCVSRNIQKYLEDSLEDIHNTNVVYNPIDSWSIIELSNQFVQDEIIKKENCINIVTAGRFVEIKRYDRIINVIKTLVQRGIDNVHFYLIGAGKLENSYREQIQKNGLEKFITILGYRSNPFPYIKSSDIFICSSESEGFSTAVTEAIILEKLVLTTDCGGMREIIGENNEYGIIVENSEEGLYEGLEKILLNPSIMETYREKIAERASAFNYQQLVEETEEMLLQVIEE